VTPVCEISNGGVTTWRWLCARHQADRRGAGWFVKPSDRDAPWICDDCTSAEQASPGYVTPTMAMVKTDDSARLPTAAEYKRTGPPETWAARLARLREQREVAA
jgi:hypothetical protein